LHGEILPKDTRPRKKIKDVVVLHVIIFFICVKPFMAIVRGMDF